MTKLRYVTHTCKICHEKFEAEVNNFYPNEMITHAENHLARHEKPQDSFLEV